MTRTLTTLALAGLFAFLTVFTGPTSADQPSKEHLKERHALPTDVPTYLQDISVTIHAGSSQGSGVIKTRDGINYVWTAGHVVASLRKERAIIDSRTGGHRTVIEFDDAKIVKELVEDGRSVGRLQMDAEVLRYSNADNGQDLALLRIRKKNFVRSSAVFYLDKQIPSIGTDLLHCGSLLGQMGSNSMTTGIMSQHGRVAFGVVFDQTTCAAFPGSSGGGVYLKDGRYIGMVVRGAGETFNLIVPMRRLHSWATKVGVEFALDDGIQVPSDEELRKCPVEDAPAANGYRADANRVGNGYESELRFMIRRSPETLQAMPVRE